MGIKERREGGAVRGGREGARRKEVLLVYISARKNPVTGKKLSPLFLVRI